MPKEEWGTKRLCICKKIKFYDLNTDPMVCPECGDTFTLDQLLGTKTKLPKDASTVSKETANKDDAIEELTEDELMLEDDEEPIADDLDETLLEEDDDDTVSLEEITDVSSPEDEN